MKLSSLHLRPKSRLRWALWAAFGTLLSLVAARAVEAKVESTIDDVALQMGRNVYATFEALTPKEPNSRDGTTPLRYRFALNGLPIVAQTNSFSASEAEVERLFATMRKHCETPINPVSARLPQATQATQPQGVQTEAATSLPPPILEGHGKKESYLYCLRPQHAPNAEGILSALNEYAKTKDASSFGTIQGFYLRSQDDTHTLLLFQFDGTLNFQAAFDPKTDAPGEDITDLPRPDGRRTLSLFFNDEPHLNAYHIASDPSTALEQYGKQLKDKKLSVLDPRGLEPQAAIPSSPSLVARTASDTFVIIAHPASATANRRELQSTILSITRLAR